jgi:hypothetical protein
LKSRPSKLDAHAADLRRWFGEEKVTLEEARSRLAAAGCPVSVGRLSEWWGQEQGREMEEQLLADVASGSRLAREIAAEAQDAPPQIASLIKLIERLIMAVSTRGDLPTQLKVIPSLIAPALEWSRQQHSAERLALEKQKFTTALKTKIEAGLDEIAAQIGENPDARRLYDQFRSVVASATAPPS